MREIVPVHEAVESCNDRLRVGQREVVQAFLTVGQIEKLIADEVANLFDVERTVEEFVESRSGVDISRVVNRYEVLGDLSVLFEFLSQSTLNGRASFISA